MNVICCPNCVCPHVPKKQDVINHKPMHYNPSGNESAKYYPWRLVYKESFIYIGEIKYTYVWEVSK